MSFSDYLLLFFVQYGLPVLFSVVLIASIGVPLPATLLLLTAGAFVAQGDMSMWPVAGLAVGAAVTGDHIGYSIGRWGSDRLVNRLSRWGGGRARIEQAERTARRWGGVGIFLSRWLMTPVGPVVNLTSGITRVRLTTFFCFDLLGEMVWVGLYLALGYVFSAQVEILSNTLGNFSWVIVGIVVLALLIRLLLRQRPPAAPAVANQGVPQAAPHRD